MNVFVIIFLTIHFLCKFSYAKYCNNTNSPENPCCEGYIKVDISETETICPPYCPSGCGEQEICQSPGECVCTPGFIGSDCNFPVELKYENDKSRCGKAILKSYDVKKNWYCVSSWLKCERKQVNFLYELEKHCCDGFIETSEKKCVERRR